MRLTSKAAADVKLPEGKIDYVEWDDDIAGFGLRIRKGGSRVWVYRYRIGKKQFSITLGDAAAVPLPLARENAARCQAQIKLGGNPAADKATARIETNISTEGLIDQYLDTRKSELRANSLREVKRHLLSHAKSLHGLPIGVVSQRVVASLLDAVAESSGNVTANRVRASLSAFLAWVIRQGVTLPQGNVASHTTVRKEKSRDRVLSDAEIKTIWQNLDDSDHSHITKLLLLTGQREAEIAALRWDEVWGDRIVLPGERTKNKRAHVVPLSAPAQAILEKLRVAGRTLVFGRNDSHGFRGWSIAKGRLDKRIANGGSPLSHWTLHDLRRTVATKMAELGVQPHIVEAVLNHVSGHRAGVAGIYNRASYATEKREALNLWAGHVLTIVRA